MTRVEKANSKAQAEVDEWNAKHEVGTVVRYWSMLKRGDPTGETPTIDPAYVSPSGDAVVPIRREGRGRDYIILAHVEVL